MMNYIKILGLVGLSLFFNACRTDSDTRTFLPGTYVNHAEGEYSVSDDTLIFQPIGVARDAPFTYRIFRRTAFRRKVEGKLMKREWENEEWIAVYDEQTKSLQEIKRGKQITLYPDSGLLLIGRRKYRKLQKD